MESNVLDIIASFVLIFVLIATLFGFLHFRIRNDVESADALIAKTADSILQLMIKIEISEDCDICWIGPGETSFERLWFIYTELVGNDDLLQETFPHYA